MTGSTEKIIMCLNYQEVPQFICTMLTSRHSVLNVHISSSHFLKKVKTYPLNFKVNKRLDVSVSGLSNRQDSYWRKQWHPTPVLLPGKSHGRRSLVGCSPWGGEELDMTEQLHFHFSLSCIGEGNGNPLQYSCLENPRDGRACGHTELDTTEATQQQQQDSQSRARVKTPTFPMLHFQVSI